MPETVVGLFQKPEVINDVVREIEALGFPRREVRTLEEPAVFEDTGVMSFPRLDFEVSLRRELTRIGATKEETEAYVEGLKRGGALVFATGPDDKVKAAVKVMNLHGAEEIEEVSGVEPALPVAAQKSLNPTRYSSAPAGRILQPGGGASIFTW